MRAMEAVQCRGVRVTVASNVTSWDEPRPHASRGGRLFVSSAAVMYKSEPCVDGAGPIYAFAADDLSIPVWLAAHRPRLLKTSPIHNAREAEL
jgi:hypothetical protein